MSDKPPLKPVVLIILSGWGIASPSEGNMISLAKTPIFNRLASRYETFILNASGKSVGLSEGEAGNSEIGQLNIGAGRIVYQILPKIDVSIDDGSFFNKKVFAAATKQIKKNKSALHLLGLISNAKIYSSLEHLYALLKLAKQEKIKEVYIHVILDGIDSSKNSGLDLIKQVQEKISAIGIGEIASISGRFYAMDDDNHWDRTEKAYLAIAEGESKIKSINPAQIISNSYKQEIYDEKFLPTTIVKNNQPIGRVKDNDVIIFFNFQPDKIRQLARAFAIKEFDKFERPRLLKNLFFISLTEYEKDLPIKIVFPPEKIKHPLADIISRNKLSQLHIAETEKYAPATLFFNGKNEKSFWGEKDILVSPPNISLTAPNPGMSTLEISKIVIQNVLDGNYNFILTDFANLDLMLQVGDKDDVIKSVEIIDKALGNITDAVLSQNGIVIITSDHGGAEEFIDLQTGTIKRSGSTNPVPLILIGKKWEKNQKEFIQNIDLSLLRPSGKLADIAPTILKIMGLSKPKEMTGKILITN